MLQQSLRSVHGALRSNNLTGAKEQLETTVKMSSDYMRLNNKGRCQDRHKNESRILLYRIKYRNSSQILGEISSKYVEPEFLELKKNGKTT